MKRVCIKSFVLISLLLTETLTFSTPAITQPWGDINGDGVTTTCDLCELKRSLVGLEDISPYVTDLNCDGRFSLIDVVLLKQHLLKHKKS